MSGLRPESTAPDTFVRALVRLRQSRGLSQAALAQHIGCSQALVSHFERGYRIPAPSTLQRLLDGLEATPAETRTLVDAAGLCDVRYTIFSIAHRERGDEDFVLAWEQLLATLAEPLLPRAIEEAR